MPVKKTGECDRCGKCCGLHCPFFSWIALRDIKKGESFASGLKAGAIKAHCSIFNTYIIEGSCTRYLRLNFPFNAIQRPPKCGYTFVEAKESE